MAKIKLPADGQEIDLPDAIAQDDQLLKDALSPVYPDLANAKFSREEKNGVLTVTVTKQAGTKGGDMPTDAKFYTWAIVELLGHTKIAGIVTEEERFGTKLGRCDIPAGDQFVTQYFSGSSVYRLTPCSEEIARSVAIHNVIAPAHRWELPKAAISSGETAAIESDYPMHEMESEDDSHF